MRVFNFDDYRAYIRHRIGENAAVRGYQGKLAEAAGCKPAYLSQVLNSHVQLTPDHAAGLCSFWRFDEEESEYFLALVNHSRAATARLRDLLGTRMTELRKKHENISNRVRVTDSIPPEGMQSYYGSWYMAAVHLIVSIPSFRTVDAIAERLGLAPGLVHDTLVTLEKLGLVRRAGEQWNITGRWLHLPRESPLCAVNNQNWRQRALLSEQERRDGEALHYTSVHTLSRRDVARLKEMVLDFIQSTRKVIEPSPEEDLICLCLDFFRVLGPA